jgi:hypothetical protein
VIGALLIATAVIARNYDNAAILLRPGRIIAPYAISLVSSLWIYGYSTGPIVCIRLK